MAYDTLAFDFSSVRAFDENGHMRVSTAPISAAVVSEYGGREIPGWQELGLDQNRFYKMLRDPDELAKAASSFRGKPILLTHRPIAADNHPHEIVVGSVGDDVVFDGTFLRGPLTFWDADAIRLIENGEKKSLSAGYSYVPIMQGGTWNGQRYDGRMTRLSANHLAIVSSPRVPGCVVGDEDPGVYERLLGHLPEEGRAEIQEALSDAEEERLAGIDPTDKLLAFLADRLGEGSDEFNLVLKMLRRDPVDWKTPDERESEMASDEDRFPHMSRLKGRVLVAKPRPPVRRDTPQQRADFERRFPNANRLK